MKFSIPTSRAFLFWNSRHCFPFTRVFQLSGTVIRNEMNKSKVCSKVDEKPNFSVTRNIMNLMKLTRFFEKKSSAHLFHVKEYKCQKPVMSRNKSFFVSLPTGHCFYMCDRSNYIVWCAFVCVSSFPLFSLCHIVHLSCLFGGLFG